MHDDDVPVTPEPEELENYWTEAQWEQFMWDNEKLMDRYEQVMRGNPDRVWRDPLDLYHKVHYDLDLGEEREPEPSGEPELAEVEDIYASEGPVEPAEAERDDFRQIPAYKLAFEFATAALEYLKRFESEKAGRDPLRDEFCRHALRIAADIAGGHGLGDDEGALCGNIVKNRWALNHAQEARQLLQQILEHEGPHLELTALLRQLPTMITLLQERIAELRAKVWWDR